MFLLVDGKLPTEWHWPGVPSCLVITFRWISVTILWVLIASSVWNEVLD